MPTDDRIERQIKWVRTRVGYGQTPPEFRFDFVAAFVPPGTIDPAIEMELFFAVKAAAILDGAAPTVRVIQ